jgi:hypothetical protein
MKGCCVQRDGMLEAECTPSLSQNENLSIAVDTHRAFQGQILTLLQCEQTDSVYQVQFQSKGFF